jgi:hypothetical protein
MAELRAYFAGMTGTNGNQRGVSEQSGKLFEIFDWNLKERSSKVLVERPLWNPE